jgi:glucan phosphoethanolaminetransferase (alkaline phosphatase superfamily)
MYDSPQELSGLPMLWVLLFVAVAVLAANRVRPSPARWRKALTWAAAILLLAVLVALGIEAAMQSPVE